MKDGRKPGYPEKARNDELQKMPHTEARKSKPQPRLKPELWHRCQALAWRHASDKPVTPKRKALRASHVADWLPVNDELQKMPHTKPRKFKPQPRFKPQLWHWWHALAWCHASDRPVTWKRKALYASHFADILWPRLFCANPMDRMVKGLRVVVS